MLPKFSSKKISHSRSPKTAWKALFIFSYYRKTDLLLILEEFYKTNSIKELSKKSFENTLKVAYVVGIKLFFYGLILLWFDNTN